MTRNPEVIRRRRSARSCGSVPEHPSAILASTSKALRYWSSYEKRNFRWDVKQTADQAPAWLLPYFFRSAHQFITTVMGAFSLLCENIKNRWPSALTS
jgi:hypothetical protein